MTPLGNELGEWITLRGEKDILATMLGRNTLWGDAFAELLKMTR